MTVTSPPMIGVTLDHEASGGYSKFPWYAVRENYMASLSGAGALPVALPHDPETAAAYLDRIEGLIVTGGAFDVDPALFGATDRHDTVILKARRTEFELAIFRGAYERDMPVLAICGGEQLINVALGGSLMQHIPDAVENGMAHEQPNPRDEPGHDIAIVPNTLLHRLVGTESMAVNSAHHQAVDEPAPGLEINARASDGVIEGIEDPRKRFCLGVQWHPEFLISPGDGRIIDAFVAACRS